MDLDGALEEVGTDLNFDEFDQVLQRYEALEPHSGRLVELALLRRPPASRRPRG